MKKLLTILTLALALCMFCSIALAANEDFLGVMNEADYLALVGSKAAEGTPKEFTITELQYPDAAKLANALKAVKCGGGEISARVYGAPDGDGNIPSAIVYVSKSHKDMVKDTAKSTEPTCTKKGHNYYKCSECGYGYTDAEALAAGKVILIDALGHNYQMTTIVEATCTTEGERVTKCTRCGDELGDHEVIPVTFHNFVPTVIEEANCKYDGVVYYNCEYCGLNEDVYYGAAAPSNYADWWSGDLSGWQWLTDDPDFDFHKWDNWSEKEPATCGHVAREYRKCNICTAEQFRDDPLGVLAPHVVVANHTADQLICTLNPVNFKCKGDCGITESVAPTYDADGNLIAESTVYGDENITVYLSHKYTLSTNPADTFPATCTVPGQETYVCDNCGNTLVVVDGEALGHLWGEWEQKTAPDVENGIYGHWQRKCQREGCTEKEDYVDYELPKKTCADDAHDWFVKYPTSIDCGVLYPTVVWRCSKCNIEKTETNYLREHDLSVFVITVTAPTCTATGTDIMACSYCGYMENVVTDMLDHELSAVEAKEPTCVDEGNEAYQICANCDNLFDMEGNVIAAKPAIAATGEHKYTVKVSETAATCTKAGVIVWKCEVCDALKTEDLDKLAHDLVEEEEVPATCTEKGAKAGKYCKNCEYKEGYEEIAALGHDYKKVEAVAATCTKDGSSEGMKCSRCDEYLVKPTVLPALGHDLVKTEAKAATCTTDGYTASQKCTRCDEATIEATPIKAKGHAWDKGEVTKPAAEGVKGEKTFTCTVCGETKTEEIPALPIPAVYGLDKLEYTDPLAVGKVTLDPATDPLTKVYARVSFFLENGDCMIQIVEVNADGTFEAGAMGNFVHISVIVLDVDNAYSVKDAIAHAHGNGGIELE